MGIDGLTVTEIAAIKPAARQQVRHDAGAGRLGPRINAKPGVAQYSRSAVERYLKRRLDDADFRIIAKLRPKRRDFSERDIHLAILRRDDEWVEWFRTIALLRLPAPACAELMMLARRFRQSIAFRDMAVWITEHLTNGERQ